MSEQVGYGFNDDASSAGMVFGLNPAAAYLTKFEWTDKGGKDGAQQEALDIVFTIAGKEVSFRQFPVTRAYDKDNNEVTDPNAPEMKEAVSNFNAMIVHILHAFVDKDTIKSALSVPIPSFKDFCNVAKSVLPKDFDKIALDIFLQYQWQITGTNNRTFLRIPKNMKHGKWLCKAITPISGKWTENRAGGKLRYGSVGEDGKVQKHPFERTEWFMNSNFAHQQSDSIEDVQTGSQSNTEGGW